MEIDYAVIFPAGGLIVYPEVLVSSPPNTLIQENPIVYGAGGGVSVSVGATVSDAGQPPEF